MAAVGTWSFSQPAVDRLRSLITSGCHATDAVEEAMAGWLKMTQIKFHPSICWSICILSEAVRLSYWFKRETIVLLRESLASLLLLVQIGL